MFAEVVSREDAERQGRKHFFTGLPCQNGHVAPRYVKRGLCTACSANSCAHRYSKNREEVRVKQAEYGRKPDVAQRNLARVNKWGNENPDKVLKIKADYRERHTDLLRKKNREYHARKPHIATNHAAMRRADQRKARPSWVVLSDMHGIYELARDITRFTGIRYSVDHIVPLKNDLVCGLHVPWNLRVIPHRDNLSKANKFNPDTYIHTIP